MTTVKKKKTAPAGKNAVKKKRRRRRRLNPVAVLLFAVIILAVYALFTVPKAITNSKLKKLGYDKETITAIKEQKLTKTLLNNEYYSDYLAQSIRKKTLNTDYIELYTAVSADDPLTDDDFLLYNRLADHGYEDDQLLNLFSQLKYSEMVPLLVLDWQWDETGYISDCIDHRFENTAGTFVLEEEYRSRYKYVQEIEDPSSTSAPVSYTHSIPGTYVPEEIESLSYEIAVDGMSLRADAAAAADKMIHDGINTGAPFFITESYVSGEDQASYYDTKKARSSEAEADLTVERSGHSEHQTGLAFNVVPTYEGGDFEDTQVFKWISEHAASYGFIQRYPTGKACITGVYDEETHFRYLGKDLAQKVTESGLTYDEYYALYMQAWSNADNVPAESILRSTGCVSEIYGQNPVKTEEPASSEENPEEPDSEN